MCCCCACFSIGASQFAPVSSSDLRISCAYTPAAVLIVECIHTAGYARKWCEQALLGSTPFLDPT